MDTLTHALSGALVARATWRRKPDMLPLGTRTLCGTLVAAFPDSDFVMRFIGDSLYYLNAHRGITHSLPMIPLWAALLASLFYFAFRRRYPWRAFLGVSALGLGTHIAGDLITSYGTMILAPFSDWRAAFPAVFIIDPWFTGIILVALIFSLPRHTVARARVGALALVSYVGFMFALNGWAASIGANHAREMGVPEEAVHVLPQPLSPFYRKIVITRESIHHVAHIDLLAREAPRATGRESTLFDILGVAYHPANSLDWRQHELYGSEPQTRGFVNTAWNRPEIGEYRRFARFPALDALLETESGACAWFVDLRFAIPGLDPPFRYGICREGRNWRLKEPPRYALKTTTLAD